MLQRPDIQDDAIAACVEEAYGVPVADIDFLPLGADFNTAVFRLVSCDGRAYFLKLRSGVFDETSATIPRYLSDQGVAEIIPPIPTRIGAFWSNLDVFTVILYSFVEGRDGYAVNLSDQQWRRLGATMKHIHSFHLPPSLRLAIAQEAYSCQWQDRVREFMQLIERETFDDPLAAQLASFLNSKRAKTLDLVERAAQYGQILHANPPAYTLCHSDLHAGNFHICDDETFYIVDWDAPILAPKERDLMYIGAGLMGGWRPPEEEELLFYAGYGPVETDPIALAYYRCERIVQDIAAYCEQLLLSSAGGEDRQQSLRYLMSNYLPDGTIAIARRAEANRALL